MTVRFWRSGTPSFGLEVSDDGVASATLSSGAAIGRFGRALSPAERDVLQRGLAAAGTTGTDAPNEPVAPGGATEHLLTEALEVSYPAGGEPPQHVAELVTSLRTLLDDLVASPVAAVVLDVSGPPYRGRLRHAGREPITVRMEGMTMTTTRYAADYAVEGSVSSRVTAAHDGPVDAGWVVDLPEPEGDASDGGFLSITVGPALVDVDGNGVLRRCEFGWVSE